MNEFMFYNKSNEFELIIDNNQFKSIYSINF